MENNEQNGPSSQESESNLIDKVKQFYKLDFKNIFILFFKNPIEGIYSVLEKPSEKSYSHSLILFASVFVLYIIGGYVIFGEGIRRADVSYINIGLFPVIMMLIISSLSFAIKSISGKPNFKNELLTGALCGIALALIVPVLLIFSEGNLYRFIRNPLEVGVVGTLLLFYVILMLINVFQQSLKSSGTKDAFAWYLSPASILLAFYITIQIFF